MSEEAFVPAVPDWLARVIDEYNELNFRLAKLNAFIGTERFYVLHPDEQRRLNRQQHHMSRYVEVLEERIAAHPRAATATQTAP